MADIIRKGSRGDEVRQLQQNLTQLGYKIQVDGIFGDATEDAIRHLQKSHGYNVDGLVGDATKFLVTQQIGFGWRSDAGANEAMAKGGDGGQMKGGGSPGKGDAGNKKTAG